MCITDHRFSKISLVLKKNINLLVVLYDRYNNMLKKFRELEREYNTSSDKNTSESDDNSTESKSNLYINVNYSILITILKYFNINAIIKLF